MAATNKKFNPGDILFKEGGSASSLFLIQKGTISVRKRVQAQDIELARCYSNEVLGELTFFDRSNRSATAVALTETEVIEIDFESLDKMWEPVPDYLKTIIRSMAERLRRADDMIRRLKRELDQAGIHIQLDDEPDEGQTTG